MKKSMLLVAAIFSIAVMFTSCKETKKEEVEIEIHEEHEHKSEDAIASSEVFKCPMDCEEGKSYEEAGACPVCKMDLKKQSVKLKHAESCTCKDGDECTCEDGKCQCNTETASVAKECGKCDTAASTCKSEKVVAKAEGCTKCEPGSCECKA
ncbi:heavy metal-binding domain-containing protein [Lutibacter holmesii]|uniref:Heavy metal-binding domain-containing protein n=1 Tax=Lutibacter holmesii TaxID=1137985 RepID=A0ABW3WMJ9_9FLAO